MAVDKPRHVREQVVVYLDERDRALLEEMAAKTGLARTELFRRGLRRLADDTFIERKPGSSIDWLIANASDAAFPPDAAERHDYYLYGGGYAKWLKKQKTKQTRARPR